MSENKNCIQLKPNLCPSLTQEVYDKLIKENIMNSLDLLSRDAEKLSVKTRISYKAIQNICKVLNAYHGSFPQSGLDLYKEAFHASQIMPTGYKCLDKILGGGILTEEIVEIFGSAGIGKTLFCLSLSFNMALNQKRYILYIDPMHSVQSPLISNMISKLNCKEEDWEDTLSRIHIIHPSNIWELLQILEGVKKGEGEFSQSTRWNLVLIDSLPQLIYPLINGSQFESFGVLNHLGKTLMKMIKIRKMAAVVVNNSVRNSADDSSSFLQFPLKPTLGRYWTHVPHTRLFLEKSERNANLPKPEPSTTAAQSQKENITLVHICKSTRLKNDSCSINL